jgi:hypothetical protein
MKACPHHAPPYHLQSSIFKPPEQTAAIQKRAKQIPTGLGYYFIAIAKRLLRHDVENGTSFHKPVVTDSHRDERPESPPKTGIAPQALVYCRNSIT